MFFGDFLPMTIQPA